MSANDRFLGPEGVEELMLLIRQALDKKAGADETARAIQDLLTKITEHATQLAALATAASEIMAAAQSAGELAAANKTAIGSLAEATGQALAGKADLRDGKVDPAQLPAMDYDPAGSADAVRQALLQALTAGLSAKQDTLSGIPGQFVGFDAAGRPVPQAIVIPEASTGYAYRFAAAHWVPGVGEVLLTVPAALHRMTGSEAACSALAGAAGAYRRTWAAAQTWASAAGNDITLHAPAAYDGCAVLTLC